MPRVLLLTVLLATPAVAQVSIEPAGYWPFDGDGSDQSGNGRDLTLVGSPGFAPGLVGSALSLTGDPSQYAVRPVDDAVFDFGSSDFTIQVWANFSALAWKEILIEKFVGPSYPGFSLLIHPDWMDLWEFWSDPSGVVRWWPPAPPAIGVWHHVVVRRTSGVFDLWVDGVLRDTQPNGTPTPDSPKPLILGRRDPDEGNAYPLIGLLDEVGVWTSALSDADIALLYNAGAGNPAWIPIPNTPPVADAGPDRDVNVTGPLGAFVVLDGSASSDPQDDPLACAWSHGPSTVTTTVWLQPGTHTFTLTVTDPDGAADTDEVVVVVQNPDDDDPPLADDDDEGNYVKRHCIVATAAFGSPDQSRVARLRAFRDRSLRAAPSGVRFANLYRRSAHGSAHVVQRWESLRALVRAALR